MLGWMPGRVLAFASTARNPVKDEMQRDLDARVEGGGGRQSRTMGFCLPGTQCFDDYLQSVWASWNAIFGVDHSPKSAGVAGGCDTCGYANDGDCDDGGPGSEYSLCARHSDCNDCKYSELEHIRSAEDCRAYYAPYIKRGSWYYDAEARCADHRSHRCKDTSSYKPLTWEYRPGEMWSDGEDARCMLKDARCMLKDWYNPFHLAWPGGYGWKVFQPEHLDSCLDG
jgi:hypothetical protein